MTDDKDRPKSGLRSDGSYREVYADGVQGHTYLPGGGISKDYHINNRTASLMPDGSLRDSYYDKNAGTYTNYRDGKLESMSIRVGGTWVPVRSTVGMGVVTLLRFRGRRAPYTLPSNLVDVSAASTPVTAPSGSAGINIAAFILALLSVLLGWTVVVPIVGLILGIVGLSMRNTRKRGLAVVAIIIAPIALLLDALFFWLIFILPNVN